MTSTAGQVETSYGVSNEFFRLWLDERMHYTCALFEQGTDTLEQAQRNKSRLLHDLAEVTPDTRVLDIGCGWGANLEFLHQAGVRELHGITLSAAQAQEIERRAIPGVQLFRVDYRDFEPEAKYGALQSIEMIDHLCSPAQSAAGMAVELYRAYFRRCASWVEPGACFGFQAILRERLPRARADLEDLRFTADVIFPGGLNPRLEELIAALNPHWELVELHTRREHYERTTTEWLRRLQAHEAQIRTRWGDRLFDHYQRYLSTCVRAFAAGWSSGVQMKLRRVR